MNSYKIQVKFPSTVDVNAYKAYVSEEKIAQTTNKSLNALDLQWESQRPKTLRIIVLDSIIQNWHDNPILSEIERQVDKNYVLENLSVDLPTKVLSTHIKDDVFWKRCYYHRWRNFIPDATNRKWISMYMEKDLTETLENLDPCNYDQEEMQTILEICAPYIQEIDVTCLQPSMEKVDHIPFDFILSNLPELKKFRVSYIAKNVGTNFYLGCSNMSANDATYLCRGLQKTYDLAEFCLHSTKVDITAIKMLSKSLDKACPNLTSLHLINCQIGDNGFMQFMQTVNVESLACLKTLILVNNFFSQQTALYLSRLLRNRQIVHLDLSMNPIGTEGAATIFTVIGRLPIEIFNVSACSITEAIGRLLLKLIVENKTLLDFNISNNRLGNELGSNIYKVIGFNKVLKRLDLRNTNIPTKLRKDINAVLFQNRNRL